jgi:hypothetical protein
LAAVAAVVLAIWVLPAVLTHHPQLEAAAEQHKASADTRAGWVAMLVAIGAAGGLAFTARTYRLSREGHITDRYSEAVEQLGSDKIEVRLGGIYALERLMRDSTPDQPTIMETLAAYVRQHARIPLPRAGETAESPETTVPWHGSTSAVDPPAGRVRIGRRRWPRSRPPGACRLMDGREKLLHVEAERFQRARSSLDASESCG